MVLRYNKLMPNTGLLHSDQTKLSQILINLLSNAAKYTENGTIELELSNSPVEPDIIYFRVIDSGVGIPPEKFQ